MAFYSESDVLQRLFTGKFLLIYSLCVAVYAGKFICERNRDLFFILMSAVPNKSDVSWLKIQRHVHIQALKLEYLAISPMLAKL